MSTAELIQSFGIIGGVVSVMAVAKGVFRIASFLTGLVTRLDENTKALNETVSVMREVRVALQRDSKRAVPKVAPQA